jgi:hypothetical protein
MTATREELHHLVDAVDEDKVPDAAALLRDLTGQQAQQSGKHPPSFLGALTGGPADLGERHQDYLHEQFARPA